MQVNATWFDQVDIRFQIRQNAGCEQRDVTHCAGYSLRNVVFCFSCHSLIVAVTVYITEHSFHECPGGRILAIFMIGLAVLLSITILLEFFIAILSAQGSILNPGPRKFLPFVLYVRLAILLIEAIWSGVAAFWVFQEWSLDGDKRCDITIIRLVKTSLSLFWGLFFIALVVVWLLFGPSIKHEEELRERSGSHTARHLRGVAKANWKKRLAKARISQFVSVSVSVQDGLLSCYTIKSIISGCKQI